MSYCAEGTIYIPLEDFWQFVQKYAPKDCGEIRYGVPRFTEYDCEINFSSFTDHEPTETKLKAEWKEYREQQKEG